MLPSHKVGTNWQAEQQNTSLALNVPPVFPVAGTTNHTPWTATPSVAGRASGLRARPVGASLLGAAASDGAVPILVAALALGAQVVEAEAVIGAACQALARGVAGGPAFGDRACQALPAARVAEGGRV